MTPKQMYADYQRLKKIRTMLLSAASFSERLADDLAHHRVREIDIADWQGLEEMLHICRDCIPDKRAEDAK